MSIFYWIWKQVQRLMSTISLKFVSKISEIEINKYISKLHIITIIQNIQKHQYRQD